MIYCLFVFYLKIHTREHYQEIWTCEKQQRVPADEHCYNDGFPACVQQDFTGWMFGWDSHPGRNQA